MADTDGLGDGDAITDGEGLGAVTAGAQPVSTRATVNPARAAREDLRNTADPNDVVCRRDTVSRGVD